MTRETKISLLVGLAFIIVIGILLSDHFHATQELPQAILTQGADIMRRATNEPGTGNPPINFVAPTESSPTQQVPTHDEMTQAPSPVVPAPNYGGGQASANPLAAEHPVQNHVTENADQALADAAQRHGESVVPANIDGSSSQTQTESAPPAPVPVVAGPKQYRAEDGDTVSRMALKFLGGNTRANRDAIINANPSLQDDPDKVIVGKMYKIPVRGQASNTADNAVATNQNDDSAAPPSPETTSSGGYSYTVQEGDSLWAIANDQLGDPGAVEKIKQMNASVLKGDDHDVVIPGMKLRLPAKPVATAQN